MRGKHPGQLGELLAAGNTPAYAGKTLHHQRIHEPKPDFSITSDDKLDTTAHAPDESNRGLYQSPASLSSADERTEFIQTNLQVPISAPEAE